MPLASPLRRVRPMLMTERSVIAPVGGLNTRDALDAMPPEDATRLDNWFPDVGKVTSRNGFTVFASPGGSIDTLVEYNAGAVRRLVGAGNGNIYDVGQATTPGTGFANNRWQAVNFKAKLLLVNGTDAEQTYDGTTVAASAWTGLSSPAIGIHVFANRVWLWESNSQTPYYAALNAITGACTAFPLNGVSKEGGNLLAMGTLSRDASQGVQNLCAFVMNNGEVILFFGTDPTSWVHQGTYKIGAPLSVRSCIPIGGDLAIITQDDYVMLSQVIADGLVKKSRSKISGAVKAATLSGSSLFGWCGILYPRGSRAMVNVPNSDGTYHQHVLNTITGAWCRFKGMNAKSWSLWNDALYFGDGSGNVCKADTGSNDNGAAIVVDGLQAWNQLGTPLPKRIAMARPVIQATGTVSYSFGMGYDFADPLLATPTTITATGSPWDTSPWNITPWSPEAQINAAWRVMGGKGRYVSSRLYASLKTSMDWFATGLRFEKGTGL